MRAQSRPKCDGPAQVCIEPGNRVDRFLATVAYLDGNHPSVVFARGYYTRTTLIAYDWDGRQLKERWYVDSDWVDALHVTDIDPNRPGLEIYMVHEGGAFAPYGHALRDGATREVLYGAYSGVDTGRGMVGDILPDQPGLEAWAVSSLGLWTADGQPLGATIPGTNMSIRWAADMTTQLVNGTLEVTPSIDDWLRGRLLTADGTRTNNGTKGTPSLVADIIGDWREELLVRTLDSTAIRIYLSTELTPHKLYTLMHDPQYRAEVARQQTTYNQPSYTSFHLGAGTDWSRVPVPRYRAPRRR